MKPDPARVARFQEWWGEHRGIVWRIIRSYAADPEDQEDLRQEMAAQLWRSLPGFREQCRPVTWIYRVCLQTALVWRRDEGTRLRRVTTDDGPVTRAASTDPRPGACGEKEELLEKLYAAIRAQPPEQRSILLLSLDGLSYREIAELTG